MEKTKTIDVSDATRCRKPDANGLPCERKAGHFNPLCINEYGWQWKAVGK